MAMFTAICARKPAALVGAPQHALQRLSFQVLHGDATTPVDHARFERLHDVRVIELGEQPRLVQEHLDQTRIFVEVRMQALDHHRAMHERRNLPGRQVDLRHAALAEACQELVALERIELFRGCSVRGDTAEARHDRRELRRGWASPAKGNEARGEEDCTGRS